jgi:ribonuclease HII
LSVGVAVLCPSPRRIPRGLRDSKQLPEVVREAIFDKVAAWCTGWAVGHAGPDECDRLGMTAALRLATRRAFAQLPTELLPDVVVLDGKFDYVSPPAAPTLFDEEDLVGAGEVGGEATGVWGMSGGPTVHTVIGGDARCVSVAAASVLAKVTRDRMMRETATSYPPFEFERNKGYPSPTHKRALFGYGLSAVHRRSWAFVDYLPWELTSWPPGLGVRLAPGGVEDATEASGTAAEYTDAEYTDAEYTDDADADDADAAHLLDERWELTEERVAAS